MPRSAIAADGTSVLAFESKSGKLMLPQDGKAEAPAAAPVSHELDEPRPATAGRWAIFAWSRDKDGRVRVSVRRF